MTTICGTGHRPPKLGGYSSHVFDRLVTLARNHLRAHPEIDTVISGMALGWDLALAQATLEESRILHAYLPCATQASIWPSSSQQLHARILKAATKVRTISPTFTPSCMQARNEAMVQDCNAILALWDGSSGGTANCLRYAASFKPQRPVTNLWPLWLALSQGDPQ